MQYEQFFESFSLKDKVYEILKKDIILGKFKAGERLSILELANAMNISSAPIREALSMLHQDGFVVLTPRKKATVSEATMKDYHIVTQLRQMLEPYAAKISTGMIPKEALSQVRDQLIAVAKDPTDMYAFVNSDLSLHEVLHVYAGSAVLSDIMTTLKEQSLRIRYCVEDLAEDHKKMESIVTSTNEHLEILDALERGNPDEVYRSVRQHLDNYLQRSEEDTSILDALIQDHVNASENTSSLE